MERRDFIKKCGAGCMGVLTSSLMIQGCVGTKYVSGRIEDTYLNISEDIFLREDKNYLKHVVVQNDALQYPIAVFRFSSNDYIALLMKCTHQGTELQVYGDRLQCPAHGSEFSSSGEVQNGPADQSLRTFPVLVQSTNLKINLS